MSFLNRFWPWKEINRLRGEVAEKERQLRLLEACYSASRHQVESAQQTIEQHHVHFRKLARIIAMAGGFALWLCFCSLGLSQPVVRTFTTTNYSGFDSSQFQTNNGKITITNLNGSAISGSITGMIYLAWDIAAHIDATIPGVGLAEWAIDANRLTIGDGSTAGGVPLAIRYWTADTTTLLAGGRSGELAVSQSGLSLSPSTNSALFINTSKGTNWVPLIQMDATNGAPPLLAGNTANALIWFHVGNTNPAVSGGATSGSAGSFGGNIFTVGFGNAGAGTVIGTTGSGGGNGQFKNQGGDGGSVVSVANGTGGNGGTGGVFSNTGGRGGTANNGFAAGSGGNGGNLSSTGGNGGNDTATGNGFNGGGGGQFNLNGAAGNSFGSGGNGGNFIAAGGIPSSSGGNGKSAGSVTTSPNANTTARNGGNLTTFGSSYAPMTAFTTTTSAGLSGVTGPSTLLGTAAFLAPVAGQVSGKTLGSNVVDHAGRTMRFKLSGYIATSLTPTLDVALSIGGTTVIDTGAQTLVAISGNQTWTFDGELTVRTTGSSATCIGQGVFRYFSSATVVNEFATANTGTTTISTTVDAAIDVQATFSANNTIQCTGGYTEWIN